MHVSRSALLPYQAQQLFDLINDIESYPQFLDGCVGALILNQTENTMEASLELSKKGVQQRFTTRNTLDAPHSIQMELLEGPFQYLNGGWTITPLGDEGCKLSLELEFESKRGFVMQMIGKFFGEISNRLVDSIIDEAAKRYKK